MTMQRLFEIFHQRILLEDQDYYSIARAARDRILSQFRDAEPDSGGRTFTTCNWGSYAMGTGIKPLNQEYDIDLGLVFNLRPGDVSSQELKASIHNTLYRAGYNPKWNRPCLTVAFPKFHIDMAICTREGNRLFLAEGKQHDGSARWRPDGMESFVQMIKVHPNPAHSQQFRRVVRYLKRWKDMHFSADGMKGPVGLALTVMAYHWFPTNCNDLEALSVVVRNAVRHFSNGYTTLNFPYEPNDNLLRKMSKEQVFQMSRRFQMFDSWLDEAAKYERTDYLVHAFGPDFPPY